MADDDDSAALAADPLLEPEDAVEWYRLRVGGEPSKIREALRTYQSGHHVLGSNPFFCPLGPMRLSVLKRIACLAGWDGTEPSTPRAIKVGRGAGGRPDKVTRAIVARVAAELALNWDNQDQRPTKAKVRRLLLDLVDVSDSTADAAAGEILEGLSQYLDRPMNRYRPRN